MPGSPVLRLRWHPVTSIQTRCRECPRITRTEVDEMQLEKYLQREGLVQELFPDYDKSQREAIMG